MERILRLAGLPTDKDVDDFVFIVLREQTPDKRKQIIGYMLENMPDVGLLIIDGIRDLMYDINSPSESTDLINLLMRWSSGYNLHIHTVLHLNKGDDNTRGHIGTELNNKAETVLQITKSTQDGNISEVKAMHIRDREFDPFAFRINDRSHGRLCIPATQTRQELSAYRADGTAAPGSIGERFWQAGCTRLFQCDSGIETRLRKYRL